VIDLLALLNQLNETLASAIVLIAFSLLLYNLARNLHDRVARTSGIVLGCMTIVYIVDVFISLNPSLPTYEAALRLQWIGIAFMPVAIYHLSDALLATTGLPSRGRRRRVIRLLYVAGAMFVLAAAFTNVIFQPVPIVLQDFNNEVVISLRARELFPFYVFYALVVTAFAFYNVQRARIRCLTRGTRRRMGYLQIAMLTPAVGVFPFSIFLGAGEEFSLIGLLLVNAANVIVIFMLLFLAYPLSFFGSRVPDRQVKADLLRFMLRGPATGLLALITMTYTTPMTRVLGLPGESFMLFAVVGVVLLWQWFVHLALPHLERLLVYSGEDYERLTRLQSLGERLLTRADLLQLLEALLEAVCDNLRVTSAFAISVNGSEDGNGFELLSAVGALNPPVSLVAEEWGALSQALRTLTPEKPLLKWQGFWLAPIYSSPHPHLLHGILGMQSRASEIDLTEDERASLHTYLHRAAQTLDDLKLQSEIFAALEGLLPQMSLTRASAAQIEYSPPRMPSPAAAGRADDMEDRELFTEQVRAALRHFWGGPGLTESRLLELQIVKDELAENDVSPARALRAVITKAIERQRPEGERKLHSPEWTIYNILVMRFLERMKVRDVAAKLAMGESDLFRKQRVAIESVASTLYDMERARRLASSSDKKAQRA
jgi:hypothetical protein